MVLLAKDQNELCVWVEFLVVARLGLLLEVVSLLQGVLDVHLHEELVLRVSPTLGHGDDIGICGCHFIA